MLTAGACSDEFPDDVLGRDSLWEKTLDFLCFFAFVCGRKFESADRDAERDSIFAHQRTRQSFANNFSVDEAEI